MAQFERFEVEGKTLDRIAEAIRREYNFDNLIDLESVPTYINHNSNLFWLTHYNEKASGSGSIYTASKYVPLASGDYVAKFIKNSTSPNKYQLQTTWDYRNTEVRGNRVLKSGSTPVSLGCSYTRTAPDYNNDSYNPRPECPDCEDGHLLPGPLDDNNVKLTNGIKPSPTTALNALSDDYSAWSNSHSTFPIDITIDLGVRQNVSKCELYGAFGFWGVTAPTKVEVYVSNDSRFGEASSIYKLGESTSYSVIKNSNGEDLTGNPSCRFFNVTVDSGVAVKGRYVKILIYSFFAWLCEVSVYAASDSDLYSGFKSKLNGTNISLNNGECVKYTNFDLWRNNIDDDCYSLAVRKSSSYYYDIVGDTIGSNIDSLYNSLVSGDIIIASKGMCTDVDLSEFLSATYKYAVITDDSAEVLLSEYPFISYAIDAPTENDFIYMLSSGGNDSSKLMRKFVDNWNLNDYIILNDVDIKNKSIPTSTPDLMYYDDNYGCTSEYFIDNSDKPQIVVDGILNDAGWRIGGWQDINNSNGYLSASLTDTWNFRYKIKADSTYLYVGFYSPKNIPIESVTDSMYFRLWIRSEPSYSRYSHFYGLNFTSNGPQVKAVYNTSTTSGSPANINNSSIDLVYKITDSGTIIEFKVRLDEFMSNSESFEYYVSFSVNDSIVMYANPASSNSQLPYNTWDSSVAYVFNVNDEDISAEEAVALLEEML